MSGAGAPPTGPVAGAEDLRVVVLASRWHTSVMDGLLAGAHRALTESRIARARTIRVPGTFELTVLASRLAGLSGTSIVAGSALKATAPVSSPPPVDAIIALGVVIRGGTPHFDYICQAVTAGLTEVAVHSGVPVGFGVLTCDTEQQALNRAGLPGSAEDKGYEAAQAALTTAVSLREFTW